MNAAPSRRESGQAAVEAAITLPLMMFMMLGTLQLGLMLQARILAQYAVYRAVRTGVVSYGNCEAMADAAAAALIPSFYSYMKPTDPRSAAIKYGEAFGRIKRGWESVPANRYHFDPVMTNPYDGPIFWLRRLKPTLADVSVMPRFQYGEDQYFDTPPSTDGAEPIRLEVEMVYWYPMRIPFANWVLSRIAQAQFGIQEFTGVNPIQLTQVNAQWEALPVTLDAQKRGEITSRYIREQYVMPIPVSYTLRMMTPARTSNFIDGPYCGPTP